jgi:profilin
MSWDSYISEHLMVALPNGKSLSHAAIIGQDGGIWAKDSSFPDITPDQISAIVKGFDGDSKITDDGIHIGEQKFLAVQGEPGAVIRGRKGDDGVCIKKTATAIVVGIYGQGVQAGDCNVIVEGLGDYLKEMGV